MPLLAGTPRVRRVRAEFALANLRLVFILRIPIGIRTKSRDPQNLTLYMGAVPFTDLTFPTSFGPTIALSSRPFVLFISAWPPALVSISLVFRERDSYDIAAAEAQFLDFMRIVVVYTVFSLVPNDSERKEDDRWLTVRAND